MFSEGQSPTDVVIELDLSPEEVRMIYRQYLETKNMYDFLQAFDQIKKFQVFHFFISEIT